MPMTDPTLPDPVLITVAPTPLATKNVTSGDASDLQTKLTGCNLGDWIVLPVATYSKAGGFTLPVPGTANGGVTGTGGDNYVTIISANYASLPATGTRVALADASNMPTIKSNTGASTTPVLSCSADAAHHYRFVGIKFTTPQDVGFQRMIYIGPVTQVGDTYPNPLHYPSYFSFERCIFQPDYDYGCKTGVQLDGSHMQIVDSYMTDHVSGGAIDCNAVFFYVGAGPYKLHNNRIEAMGENINVGSASNGGVVVTAGFEYRIPSDITITSNYIRRKLTWKRDEGGYVAPTGTAGHLYSKNLLEFKAGKNILIDSNYFENHWPDLQRYSLTVTPREYGYVTDLTVTYNKFYNCAGPSFFVGDSESGLNFGPSPYPMVRVKVENNLWDTMNTTSMNSLTSAPFYGAYVQTGQEYYGVMTSENGGTITAGATTGTGVTFTASVANFQAEMVNNTIKYSTGVGVVKTVNANGLTCTVDIGGSTPFPDTSAHAVGLWSVGPASIVNTPYYIADSWNFNHNSFVGANNKYGIFPYILNYDSHSSKATNCAWTNNVAFTGDTAGTFAAFFTNDLSQGTVAIEKLYEAASLTWNKNVLFGDQTRTGNNLSQYFTGAELGGAGTSFAAGVTTCFHDPDPDGADAGGSIGFADYAAGNYTITGTYATAATDGTMIGCNIATLNTKMSSTLAGVSRRFIFGRH